MEKFYRRKEDGKMFQMLAVKPFVVCTDIENPIYQKFDIAILKADDDEVELDYFPILNQEFEEVKE